MKLCPPRAILVGIACVLLYRPGGPVYAGGLLLPGAGAVSTSRAGASVAAADDGEAVVLNPAGIAQSEGTVITLSATAIQYVMQFQRRGTYDAVPGETYPYADQPFALTKNDARPEFGVGGFQPIPVAAIISDLGKVVPGLHVGVGLYAPNSYPFRNMCTQLGATCQRYTFNSDPNIAPPPARYDVVKQDAFVILPSLVAAVRVIPELDIGARVSVGTASFRATLASWGLPANYEEDIKKDAFIALDASDSLIYSYGFGVTIHATPNIDLAASYNSEIDIHAKGSGTAQTGPSVALGGVAVTIGPHADPTAARCAAGGSMTELKACVDFELPRNAQAGLRYKLLDGAGRLKGDLEFDVNWENWGKTCSSSALLDGTCTSPSDFRAVVDADVYVAGASVFPLKDVIIRHGLKDTYGVRVGGSYRFALDAPGPDGKTSELIVRGGAGYDTAAATTGWLRSDFDGAARTTLAFGLGLRTRNFEVSFGGGMIFEGDTSNPNVGGGATPCNPPGVTNDTCNGSTVHQGPDPVNPVANSDSQPLNPVAQGDYQSHYLLLMGGITTWF